MFIVAEHRLFRISQSIQVDKYHMLKSLDAKLSTYCVLNCPMTSAQDSQDYLFANEGLLLGDDDLLATDLTEDELAAHLQQPSIDDDFPFPSDAGAVNDGLPLPAGLPEQGANDCLEVIDRALNESQQTLPESSTHLFPAQYLPDDRDFCSPEALERNSETGGVLPRSFCLESEFADEATLSAGDSVPLSLEQHHALQPAIISPFYQSERPETPEVADQTQNVVSSPSGQQSQHQQQQREHHSSVNQPKQSHVQVISPQAAEFFAPPTTPLTLLTEMPDDENDNEYWANRAATIAEAAKCRHRDALKDEHRAREEKASREGTPLTSLQKERSRSRRESSVTRMRAQVYVRELEAIARAVPALQRELARLRELVAQLQDISAIDSALKGEGNTDLAESPGNLVNSMESLELENDGNHESKTRQERGEAGGSGAKDECNDSAESIGSWKNRLSEWVGF